MTLVACPECAHQVSTEARRCPQCGHPVNTTRLLVRVVVFVGVSVAAVLLVIKMAGRS